MLHVCLIIVFFVMLLVPTLLMWSKTEKKDPYDLAVVLAVDVVAIILIMLQVSSLTEELLK